MRSSRGSTGSRIGSPSASVPGSQASPGVRQRLTGSPRVPSSDTTQADLSRVLMDTTPIDKVLTPPDLRLPDLTARALKGHGLPDNRKHPGEVSGPAGRPAIVEAWERR